ncbi:MAG TPA: hypothetical protein V6D47_21185 [Oscillatoriaceae cyanobacterium]
MSDRIELETVVRARPEHVFEVVAEPGWFIGGGDRTGQKHSREGELEVLDDPRYGRFAFRFEQHEAPRRLAFRCGFAPLGEPVPDPRNATTTLITFEVAAHADGALLRVIESGIEAYMPDESERARFVEGNTAAWTKQLAIAKAIAENPSK